MSSQVLHCVLTAQSKPLVLKFKASLIACDVYSHVLCCKSAASPHLNNGVGK